MKKLEQLTNKEWDSMVADAVSREENDDHLPTEERTSLLSEHLRRNPQDRKKLTNDLDNDFVDLVL